jgi:hypothetical protein
MRRQARQFHHRPDFKRAEARARSSFGDANRLIEILDIDQLRTSPQSLVVAGFLARRPCDLRTWFPGPSRGSLLEPDMQISSIRLTDTRRHEAHAGS